MKSKLTVFLLTLSILARCRQGESFSASQEAPIKVESFPAGNNIAVPQNPTSAKLLSLLQQKFSLGDEGNKEINKLVSTLTQSESYFDPKTCINGPFYATCYFIGNEPLWEKISKFFKRKTNLKGQKYTINEGANSQNRVVNYSEIFGNAINLQASGNFVESKKQKKNLYQDSASDETISRNFLETFLKPLFSAQTLESPELRKCPFDYDVTVTGASINLFDKTLEIPITGVGCARVMYADPFLRIFMSPRDTEVLSGGGDWETAGLTTVQVRVDLIESSFQDNL